MKDKPPGKPSGRQPFDRLCAGSGSQHRLTRPFSPQTNGMVERFNRRIADALRNAPPAARNGGKNRFASHAERNRFIHDFVHAYNRTRLKCLDYTAPIQALNNPPGHNTQAGAQEHGRPPGKARGSADKASATSSEEHTSDLQSLMRTSYAVF